MGNLRRQATAPEILVETVRAPTPRDYQYAIDSWHALNGFAIAAAMAADRPAFEPKHRESVPIPVILISGFLGSGKTTLLNRILREPGSRTIAAVVNDFGALNIDTSLIERRDGDLIGLENGCVCCTPSAGMTQALLELTAKASHLDAVVIETSGVADPLAIGLTIAAIPGVRLDGVVTLVDAVALDTNLHHAELGTLIKRQVAAADLVLINKIDQVAIGETHRGIDWVRSTAPSAAVLRTQHADVPTDLVLGLDEPHDLLPPNPLPSHAEFRTSTLAFNQSIDRQTLTTWLQTIPSSILRLKGFVCLVDDGEFRPVIVQGVGRRYTLEETHLAAEMENRLVVIGLTSDLDTEEINRWAAAVGAQPL